VGRASWRCLCRGRLAPETQLFKRTGPQGTTKMVQKLARHRHYSVSEGSIWRCTIFVMRRCMLKLHDYTFNTYHPRYPSIHYPIYGTLPNIHPGGITLKDIRVSSQNEMTGACTRQSFPGATVKDTLEQSQTRMLLFNHLRKQGCSCSPHGFNASPRYQWQGNLT
jgi:hypothetical protein